MIDHSDFQDTDIPFEIPLPEKAHLTVSITAYHRVKHYKSRGCFFYYLYDGQ